jgi:FkbM family methyltransferase
MNYDCEKYDLWHQLRISKQPIFIYGMGNGAEKIVRVMAAKGLSPAGFFASDEFVRGQSFLGFKVKKLSEVEAEVPEFTVLCAFGTNRKDVMARILEISKRHSLFIPDVPVCGENLFDSAFYEENREKIDEAESLFADEVSRKLYRDIIKFKLSGNPSFLEGNSNSLEEIYSEAVNGRETGVYADLGAYDGDTVNFFAEHFAYKKIYAFEPQEKNFKKLTEKTSGLKNIEYINAAAWDRNTEIPFSGTDNRNNNAFSGGASLVSAVRGDDIIKDADLIKIDVEGAEAQAIDGLTENIRGGAALICALYHRSEDIFEIPRKIRKMRPDSVFGIRKIPYFPAWDVFLTVK